MLALKEFVEEKISKVHQNHTNSSSESIDTADQIKKFKQLADDGIITQDEFEAKKERLLNL